MTSFFFSSRRRHTRWPRDWSSDVCSSDLSAHESQPGRSLVPGCPATPDRRASPLFPNLFCLRRLDVPLRLIVPGREKGACLSQSFCKADALWQNAFREGSIEARGHHGIEEDEDAAVIGTTYQASETLP